MRDIVESSTRVIHVFDREGDITEVFDTVRQLQHTGVLVRASHNRSLDQNSQRLWDFMASQPISFEQDIDLPTTSHRQARKTKLAVRFAPVQLRTPYRFDNRDPLIEILNPVQLEVLKAGRSKQLPSTLTVAWAVESVAALGGYLEHRRNIPIGIQVLWRGWLKLHDLCQGWQLARAT